MAVERKHVQGGVHLRRAHAMFNAWASGKSYAHIAGMTADGRQGANPLTHDEVRRLIRNHVRALWFAHDKWKRAERRCRALGMELRYLRLGQDCAPDQPIEVLSPLPCWARAFHAAGVDTVRQLRSVDAEMMLAIRRFPRGAIDWAIMKLDKEGLSHVLRCHQRDKRPAMTPLLGKKIIR